MSTGLSTAPHGGQEDVFLCWPIRVLGKDVHLNMVESQDYGRSLGVRWAFAATGEKKTHKFS